MRSGLPDLARTDLHSHLAPGVDDGAATVEESLEAIERMAGAGIGRIVTTPHLRASLTLDPEALRRRLGAVDLAMDAAREAIAGRFPGVVFARGHEIVLDVPNPDLSDPRVRLAGGPYALVEWPWFQIPPETASALRGLGRQGVVPLIAHPERYRGYDAGLTHIPRWRAEGAALQVSYASLFGLYGSDVRELALRILAEGWADCLSSDFHGGDPRWLPVTEAEALFRDFGGDEAWALLTVTNPARIAAGEAPHPVPPVTDRRGIVGRFLARFRGRALSPGAGA